MTLFVDTSGLFATLDADDHNHRIAGQCLSKALGAGDLLVTTSCVLVETHALVQRRLGMDVLRRFQQDIVPILEIEWVEQHSYSLGADMVGRRDKRTLSLVDCISFIVMKRLGIKRAFTFDEHFREEGFDCRPRQV